LTLEVLNDGGSVSLVKEGSRYEALVNSKLPDFGFNICWIPMSQRRKNPNDIILAQNTEG